MDYLMCGRMPFLALSHGHLAGHSCFSGKGMYICVGIGIKKHTLVEVVGKGDQEMLQEMRILEQIGRRSSQH